MSKEVPTGVELTPFDPAYLDNPYPTIKRLRELDPFHEDVQLKRFFPCRYDDVRAILRDSALLTDPHNSKPDSFARHFLAEEGREVSMLLADEPRHLRLRRLVNDLFKPKAVERWRDRVEDVVAQQLDQLLDDEFDLIECYASVVPAIVIAEIMGIPAERQAEFRRWADQSAEAVFSPDPSPEAVRLAEEGGFELDCFFRQMIAERREAHRDDLITQLLDARIDGDKLSDQEVVDQCVLLLVAGNLTTTDMIGNGVRALLENPDQLALLRQDPGLIEAAVEEVLRYDSPVLNSARITAEDSEVRGCPVQKGECLHVSLAGANHDPAVYPNPEKFDIQREQVPHQSFGGGRHFCLGAYLARMEGQIAILRLIERFPSLRLSERGFQQKLAPEFRGMSECWLSID